MKKLIHNTIKFYLFLGIFAGSSLNAGYVEIDTIERELYIVTAQHRMLTEKLAEEQKKYFNHSRIQAYEDTIEKYKKKKDRLQKERDEVVGVHNSFLAKLNQLEGQITSLPGMLSVQIDLERQEMFVYKGDTLVYFWRVSTAMNGYVTPRGNYRPYHTAKLHLSKQYDDAPMPYSVFFKDGYAIHGTEHIRSLGRRASHGCVRLHPGNANKLYNLVRTLGYNATTIKIK